MPYTPMTRTTFTRTGQACLVALGLLAGASALAAKSDRNQPMNVEADSLRHEDGRQTSIFTGNVVVNKGSIVIRGQQIEVRQGPQGQQFGTVLGNAVTRRHGGQGLPDGTIDIHLRGSAGQSFGAFVPRGLKPGMAREAREPAVRVDPQPLGRHALEHPSNSSRDQLGALDVEVLEIEHAGAQPPVALAQTGEHERGPGRHCADHRGHRRRG